ncbi:hypothetical protein KAR26_01060 [Candidatus Parcubacteria bacterium]|nr:hypothetical protein [Candidatus Parcubacteria bacterium]
MKKEDSVKELIKKSGNTFHYQVINFLKKNNWEVLISPYYNDNQTNKAREIDIIAEKKFAIESSFRKIGDLNIRFFIECKYIDEPNVFWFDDRDNEKTIKRIIKDTGHKHPNENILIKNHHYLKNKQAAKLFASAKSKLFENEPVYKALNQSLNGMIYYKNSAPTLQQKPTGKIIKILKTVNYPLILFNNFDKIYQADLWDENDYSKTDESFQLEVNYAYLDIAKNNINEYFLIDIIDFNKFDKFLENLERTDIEAIKTKLISNNDSIRYNK